jgi:predicted phosphate transport protein (TIGR00153 family)
MALLFRRTNVVELQIDEYLDQIVQGGLVFKEGVRFYMEGRTEEFEARLSILREMENTADTLRRTIESQLYLQTLIPESRGDVLGLLESADKVLNILTDTLLEFSVEIPEVPPSVRKPFLDLIEFAVNCSEHTVGGIRAYFRNLAAVRDHINKVQLYRRETNRMAENIKRTIFRSRMSLSKKIHVRYFSYHIERIAEQSDDVCDRLAIAAIKKFE